MLYKFNAILVLLISLVNLDLKSQSIISGQLIIDTTIWRPIAYLSLISDFDKLNTMSIEMIVDKTEIDPNGRFQFRTEYLPKEDNLFRIHIVRRSDPPASLLIGGKDENYIFVIANNRSQIAITDSSDKELIKDALIKGYYPNIIIRQIDEIANYLDSTTFDGSPVKIELIKSAISEKLRAIADTCSNALVSLYALNKSNYEKNYYTNQQFYRNFFSKWKKDKSTYFVAFRKKVPSTSDLKTRLIILIGALTFTAGFLICLVGFKLFKKNKNLLHNLSVQERKIFALILEGKSNKEISEILIIGLSTVKSHLNSIYSKLDLNSRKDILNLDFDKQDKLTKLNHNMKKFLLFIAVVSLSLAAMSQKGKVTSALSYIDQGILDKAKEAIDQALVNEKSKDWFNTYFAKGKLCQASFESENIKYKSLYPDPLEEAYASYEKAIELDPKGTIKKKIVTNMIYNSLAVNLFKQGSSRFENKDFSGALKSFESQIKITEGDKYAGSIDTGMYYNAALSAINAKKYHDAIQYLERCTEMKYLGIRPYFDMQACYLGLGDTLKAESILKNLSTSFPNEKDIYLQLIDLYINSNKNQEALKYIKIAKEHDPNNYSLFYVSGIIYLKQNNYDFAITDLLRSVELNPDYFDSQLSLGITYINKAADLNILANEIMDIKKYNEAVAQLNNVYAKALPYIEKANELNPGDIYTMSRLQELYYRLGVKDSSLNQKYLNIKAKIDALDKK